MADLEEGEDASVDLVALDRARYFFRLCDWEKKGYILKSDLRRLRNDLPDLTEEQLDEVFNRLDRDGNLQLTIDEFIHGFAEFLGLQYSHSHPRVEPGNLQDELSLIDDSPFSPGFTRMSLKSSPKSIISEEVSPEEHYEEFLDRIGDKQVFQDHTVIRALWKKLNKDQPELLDNFEEFLQQVADEIQKKNNDFTSLESIFQQRILSRDEEVQFLYEEMEAQIRLEKERVMAEERRKAEKLHEELQRKITEKDREMEDLIQKHSEMEKKLEDLAGGHAQTEYEKEQLRKERESFFNQKEAMEHELEFARKAMEAQRTELENMRRQAKVHQEQQIEKSCDCEREELVKQLETLRRANRRLVDERDEIRCLQQPAIPPPIRPFGGIAGSSYYSSPTLPERRRRVLQDWNFAGTHQDDTDEEFDDIDDEPLPRCMRNPPYQHFNPNQTSLMTELGEALNASGFAGRKSPFIERIEPLGGNETIAEPSNGTTQWRDYQTVTPDRIFKVVFLGDSGVGKTCFVQRFCYNRFTPMFSATIGVDFQVKSLTVDGRMIALQLWDTAGQERYRSITKQYFRKSDGVILMYDVSSELSFLNLRNWLQCVKEGVDDDCVLCLIGNKIDLCPTEDSRVVKYTDGQKLAEQCGALFFEASAQTGFGVNNSMRALAALLREKEDKHLEKVLLLEMEVQEKKRSCCTGKHNQP